MLESTQAIQESLAKDKGFVCGTELPCSWSLANYVFIVSLKNIRGE